MKRFFIILATLAMTAGATFAQTYIQYADSADNYIRSRNWPAAERVILSALREEPGNPSNPLLVTNLGIVRNHLEKYELAVESFDLALARLPQSTVALTGRAESFIALEKYDRALADLDRAEEVDSTLTLPLAMKGYLLLRLNRPADALPVFDRFAILAPQEAVAHAGRGDCLAGTADLKEAVAAYKEALALDPRPEWRFRTGLLLLELNDLEGAAEQARLTIASAPRYGDIYILMALIHRRRYEAHEAEVAEKMARDLGADPELIRLYLGK
ncbi:MAG: tetratricopeptide repeat protein [Bacteroides sp.]|nr:tetratricopeptide repeat protein [Bacteroides sp.]